MTDRHNPRSQRPHSLDYPTLRTEYVTVHIDLDHEFPGELPPLHLPADLDGVVP